MRDAVTVIRLVFSKCEYGHTWRCLNYAWHDVLVESVPSRERRELLRHALELIRVRGSGYEGNDIRFRKTAVRVRSKKRPDAVGTDSERTPRHPIKVARPRVVECYARDTCGVPLVNG